MSRVQMTFYVTLDEHDRITRSAYAASLSVSAYVVNKLFEEIPCLSPNEIKELIKQVAECRAFLEERVGPLKGATSTRTSLDRITKPSTQQQDSLF